MNTDTTYAIRPAGRHILTIGRDLIQDNYAAVVELVKNAYDADSPDVNIEFTAALDDAGYFIVISDQGHGMSREDVINKWMVPSTRNKVDKRKSPAGRTLQGSKGVGRYATSILGTDLFLETVTPEGEKTTVYLDWSNFETAQYLDDVEILVETRKVSEPSGTRLTITGGEEFLAAWDENKFKKLRYELKRLKSPVSNVLSDDEFSIDLAVNGFPGVENIEETIKPYPIFDFFDYRISGSISADGVGTLIYSSQKPRDITEEKLLLKPVKPTGCGELDIDIRVYDRDPMSIQSLIKRGLKDEFGDYVGRLQARQLLNEYNGIGVYRNGFRIRPLGDADFDWLKLNEQRVQQPSLRIGSNQVIGYVQIQSQDQSDLIEKSARDGLRENAAFDSLKQITTRIIAELEKRRFRYRRKLGLSQPAIKVERELEQLFSFDKLKQDIQITLSRSGSDKKTTDEIIDLIGRTEVDKNRVADSIGQTVATYQSQVTLGKIINVILHEGRKLLNYLKSDIPDLQRCYDSFLKTGDSENLEEFMQIANGVRDSADIFNDLFKKIDPLRAEKRSAKKSLVLKKVIQDIISIFEKEMKSHNVSTEIKGPDEFRFLSWSQDIYAIFTNLIDNSLYWIREHTGTTRKITIEILADGDSLIYIDYRDTGPGIDREDIASEMIFEPEFTTKPGGTGLGLAIAGEAANRNDLELKAFESKEGAYFRLQPKMDSEK